MGPALIRIVAPHFTAGVVLGTGNVGFVMVVRAAPIVKYMMGWTEEHVRDYCKRKHWEVS